MIQNTVVFIVNGDGSFFKQPPNTKFTANSVNKNSIFVIAPFVNTASIIANFKVAHKTQQVSRVATLTTMQPREITNESYVFDWNVWEVKVPQPTLQFLANNRGSEILVSFNVGETIPSRVIPKFDTILAEITDTDFTLPSITVDGRYIVKVASYEYENGKYAFFNDTIIADNTEQEYKIFRAKYSGGLTPSVAFKVDPSIPMENFDEYEPSVVEQLILQANENSGDIVNLENEVVRIDGKIDDAVIRVEQDTIQSVVNTETITTRLINDFPYGKKLEVNVKISDNNDLIEVDEAGLKVTNFKIAQRIDLKTQPIQNQLDGHIEDLDNPHEVTAEQVDTYNKITIDNKDTAIMNKANNLENANMFKDVNYNNVNGVLTFTKYDDTTKAIDLPLELLVDSGYYDEVANELVLVLANSSEIRIPVGNLLTDLDAHNIRFNGSGTNYLTAKTEVESAIKELDTRVKTNADNIPSQAEDIGALPDDTPLFSGDYDDLSNKPTIDQLLGNLSTLGFVKRTGTNTYVIDTSNYQPLDADLTAISGLSGTSGLLRKTASNTWQLDTSIYLTEITKLMVEAVLTGTITTHTHNASDIVEDASHRFVTDTEKNTWNAKQNALGFTPENVANKKTTLSDSDVDYPTSKAVKTAIETAVGDIESLLEGI